MIEIGKKYRTTDGTKVRRILCVDRSHVVYPVVAELVTGEITTHTLDGVSSGLRDYALVEVKPYEDFKIDEPVMVRRVYGDPWVRRHFAGVNADGKPTTWDYGKTSWSREPYNQISVWDECRRPTAEELKGLSSS